MRYVAYGSYPSFSAQSLALAACGTARATGAAAAAKGWGALSVVAPLAAQRLVGWGRRGAATPIAVVDVVLHVLVELFEEKSALEAHLLDSTVQSGYAQARAIVVVFDVGYPAAKVDAFAVVGGFD